MLKSIHRSNGIKKYNKYSMQDDEKEVINLPETEDDLEEGDVEGVESDDEEEGEEDVEGDSE